MSRDAFERLSPGKKMEFIQSSGGVIEKKEQI
jgi:hypothetical protein